MKADLQNISKGIAGETLSRVVGLPYSGSADDATSMRAFVIAYGTGFNAKGGGEPLTTRPGEMVWDKELESQHISKARAIWKLPDGWNQPYTDFIDVAVRNMKMEYIRFLDSRKDEIVRGALKRALTFK